MFLAETYEPTAHGFESSVTLTVAVAAFVVVALGWMSRAASHHRNWPEPELDDD